MDLRVELDPAPLSRFCRRAPESTRASGYGDGGPQLTLVVRLMVRVHLSTFGLCTPTLVNQLLDQRVHCSSTGAHIVSTTRFHGGRRLHETRKAEFSGIPRLSDLLGFPECRGLSSSLCRLAFRISTLSAHQRPIPADRGTDPWLAGHRQNDSRVDGHPDVREKFSLADHMRSLHRFHGVIILASAPQKSHIPLAKKLNENAARLRRFALGSGLTVFARAHPDCTTHPRTEVPSVPELGITIWRLPSRSCL